MIEPNFHAVTAAALFAGFYFRSRAVAAAVPLVAMVASDGIIGGYAKEVMVVVYASMLLPLAWSGLLRRRLTAAARRRWGGHVQPAVLPGDQCGGLALGDLVRRSWQGLAKCYATAVAVPGQRRGRRSDVLAGPLRRVCPGGSLRAPNQSPGLPASGLADPACVLATAPCSAYQCCQRRTFSSCESGVPSGPAATSLPAMRSRLTIAASCTGG